MDIRHLRYFVGIADCGSLMKASERLHVAQPSLSVHINNLEVELGVKLMSRSNRGIELTVEGHELYGRAKVLLNYYQETVSSIRDRRTTPSGTVSVGIPSTTSFQMAVEIHRRMRDELPEVTLYITDASTAMLYEWLMDCRLDFAILFSLPENATLELIPIGTEEFCLVSQADNPMPVGEIEFDDIFDLPLVVSSQSTTWRKILDDIANQRGKSFSSSIETESASIVKAIAQSGEASGVLPLSCVRQEISEGTLQARRLVNPELRGMLVLASLPSAQMTPAKRAVRDLIMRVANDMMAGDSSGIDAVDVTPILRALPGKLLPAKREAHS
jgi:LysR family transcriptional regulator, nitrogen assimilation regulatory protein